MGIPIRVEVLAQTFFENQYCSKFHLGLWSSSNHLFEESHGSGHPSSSAHLKNLYIKIHISHITYIYIFTKKPFTETKPPVPERRKGPRKESILHFAVVVFRQSKQKVWHFRKLELLVHSFFSIYTYICRGMYLENPTHMENTWKGLRKESILHFAVVVFRHSKQKVWHFRKLELLVQTFFSIYTGCCVGLGPRRHLTKSGVD